MTQICPDCGEKFPDNCNYCNRCGAKLPNAREDLPDHKSLSNPRAYEPEMLEELQEYFNKVIMSPKYHKAVFRNIVERSLQGANSDLECEKYLSSEIKKVLYSTFNEIT